MKSDNNSFSLATKLVKLIKNEETVYLQDVVEYLCTHEEELQGLLKESDKLRKSFLLNEIRYYESKLEILYKELRAHE